MQVTPISKKLSSVFRGNFLKIPRFQRPYSWDAENLSDFWYDLVERHTDEYFMGSLVLYRDSKEDNVLYVVDGQQRLTTITIALAAIRDAFQEIGVKDAANGVHGLIEAKDLDDKSRFVLEHEPANSYFQRRIQQRKPDEAVTAKNGEQTALQSARVYLSAAIRRHVLDAAKGKSEAQAKKAKKESLTKLRDRLLALQFIQIELLKEEDASIVFETLNTRGKDLQISDLVKNLFSRLIRPETKGMDSVLEVWNGMLARFAALSTPVNSDTFLLHYWLSRFEYASKAKLFKELKAKVTKQNASDMLNSISSDADIYASIASPAQAKWAKEEAELRDSLLALSIFQVAQALPLVLSILRLYKRKTIDLKSTKRSLRAIEDFTFQFNAITSSRGGGGIANMYAKLAQSASNCVDAQAFAKLHKDIRSKFSERKSELDEFEIGWSQIKYTSDFPRDRRLVRYILGRLSRYQGLPAEINPDLYTIEHIHPESKWASLSDPSLVGTLGNLVLVPEELNIKLRDKPFEQKVKLLKEAKIPIDKYVLEQKTWGADQIRARTKALSQVAYSDVWSL